MTTGTIKRCKLLDKRLEEIMDSDKAADRLEAAYRLLISDIDELLTYDKTRGVEGPWHLVLGKSEYAILMEYTKRKLEKELKDLYAFREDVDLDQGKITDAIEESIIAHSPMEKFFGMPILLSRKESFLDTVVNNTINTLDEDFNVFVCIL